MPVREVKPTRSELLEIKKKIKFSKTGHKILKMKRDGLILEFFKILEQAKQIREKIDKDYHNAMEKIAIAKAVDGAIAVQSSAFALKLHPEITLRSKNVMGLVVPEIEANSIRTPMDKRGYGVIGTSVYIDEAAKGVREPGRDAHRGGRDRNDDEEAAGRDREDQAPRERARVQGDP